MEMKDIRVHFQLPDSLYEELLNLDNGKYKNITSYIRGITHEYLSELIKEKNGAAEECDNDDIEQDEIDEMYDDVFG
jgi:hypothetical protein